MSDRFLKNLLTPRSIIILGLFVLFFLISIIAELRGFFNLSDFQFYVITMIVEAAVFISVYYYLLKQGVSYKITGSFKYLFKGILLWAGTLPLSAAYVLLLRKFEIVIAPSQNSLIKIGQSAFEKGFIIATAVLIAPIIEELFFRGCLYPVLKREFGVLTGIIVTSLLFGFLHGWPYFLQTALLGGVFAYVTEKSRSLDSAIALHILNNFVSMVTVFLF